MRKKKGKRGEVKDQKTTNLSLIIEWWRSDCCSIDCIIELMLTCMKRRENRKQRMENKEKEKREKETVDSPQSSIPSQKDQTNQRKKIGSLSLSLWFHVVCTVQLKKNIMEHQGRIREKKREKKSRRQGKSGSSTLEVKWLV